MSELHKKRQYAADFSRIPAPENRGLEVLPYGQRVERIDANNWQEPDCSSSFSEGSAVGRSPEIGANGQGPETQSASAHSSVPSRDVPDEYRSSDRSVRAARRLINLAGGVISEPASEAFVVPIEDHCESSGSTNNVETVSEVEPVGNDVTENEGKSATPVNKENGADGNAAPLFHLDCGNDSCGETVSCQSDAAPCKELPPRYFTEFLDHCGSDLLERGEALRLAGISQGDCFLTEEESQHLRILVRKLKPLFKKAMMSIKEDGLAGTFEQCSDRLSVVLEDQGLFIIGAWRSILPDKAILVKGNEMPKLQTVFAQLADVILATYFGLVNPCNTLPGFMTVLSDHNRPFSHRVIKTKKSDDCAVVFSAHMPPAVIGCLGFYKLPEKVVLVDHEEADAIGNIPLGLVPVVAAGSKPACAPGSKPDCAPRHRVYDTRAYLDGNTNPIAGLEGTSNMRYRDDIVTKESTSRYFSHMFARTLLMVMGDF